MNVDILGLFRQTTCSKSASVHNSTLKVRTIYSYSDSHKFVKTPTVHYHLSSLVQTAYRETVVSNSSQKLFILEHT